MPWCKSTIESKVQRTRFPRRLLWDCGSGSGAEGALITLLNVFVDTAVLAETTSLRRCLDILFW